MVTFCHVVARNAQEIIVDYLFPWELKQSVHGPYIRRVELCSERRNMVKSKVRYSKWIETNTQYSSLNRFKKKNVAFNW